MLQTVDRKNNVVLVFVSSPIAKCIMTTPGSASVNKFDITYYKLNGAISRYVMNSYITYSLWMI